MHIDFGESIKRGDKVRPLGGRYKDKVFTVDMLDVNYSGEICLYLTHNNVVIFRTAKRVERVDDETVQSQV